MAHRAGWGRLDGTFIRRLVDRVEVVEAAESRRADVIAVASPL
jgi:hypothetical protein